MRANLLFSAALSAALIANDPTPLVAASINKIDSKDGKTRVDLEGEVLPGDTDKLREIIKEANQSGRVVATIRLNSLGGNLKEAIQLADVVRYARTATAVLGGKKCASACFIVFAAGNEKYAHYSAWIGVHGASDSQGNETIQSNAATVTMAKVVKELGVPASIIGKMVVTPPDQMVWLTIDDLKAMGASMIGKPNQNPPDQTVQSQLPPGGSNTRPQSQLPQSILPETNGSAPSSRGSWKDFTDNAIELSRTQNNGRPRLARTCQPEMKVCTTGVWFVGKDGKQILVRTSSDDRGNLQRREICFFNEFQDVRTCLDWDTQKTHRDMQNNKGEWYKVSED